MVEWVKRQHGKGEIDRAGAFLMEWWKSPPDASDPNPSDRQIEIWNQAYGIVDNWRVCHYLPLNVIQSGLRARIRRVGQKAIVAQRLKRFSSIMNKLVRESDMKLSQMQDLGGCRAILPNVSAVTALYRMYQQPERHLTEEGSLKCYDYIKEPKDDGYRGVHVVARYHPRMFERAPWNGQRIEIQLRTKLQHAFATAVETVTTFTREPLKFGAGPTEWRRFFSLMGSALAIREQTQLVENTPNSEVNLIAELRDASLTLMVTQRLQGWANALHTLPRKHIKNFEWLLLALDTTKNTIAVTGYTNREAASKAVAEIEKSKRTDIDAVLVWVNSVRALRAAYPNYYADTTAFLDALKLALK